MEARTRSRALAGRRRRRRRAPWIVVAGAVLAAAGVAACKSTPAEPDGPPRLLSCADGSASIPGHRPQSVTCPVTQISGTEAGVSAAPCLSNADCSGSVYPSCLGGQCHVDQCLSDSDCGVGMGCACGSDYINARDVHTNNCVPAQCHVDADCGAGGLCSPARTGDCGASGFYCHSAADTCTTDADCCDEPAQPNCLYQPTIGHWACQGLLICSG
jgi:hypothetical protein